jgi:hypothetical protein
MARRFFFLLSFVLLSASALRAEPVCPWLTQGSAAAMLGGNVSAVVKLTPPEQGSCAFTLQQGATTYVLEVVVESTPRTTCPPASAKLLGIGNEAVACRLQRAPNEFVDVVSSRVQPHSSRDDTPPHPARQAARYRGAGSGAGSRKSRLSPKPRPCTELPERRGATADKITVRQGCERCQK